MGLLTQVINRTDDFGALITLLFCLTVSLKLEVDFRSDLSWTSKRVQTKWNFLERPVNSPQY